MALFWLAGSRGVLGSRGAAVALLAHPICPVQHLIRSALGMELSCLHTGTGAVLCWRAHYGNSMAPKTAPVDK